MAVKPKGIKMDKVLLDREISDCIQELRTGKLAGEREWLGAAKAEIDRRFARELDRFGTSITTNAIKRR